MPLAALTKSINGASPLSLAFKRLSIVLGVSGVTAITASWSSYQAAWGVLAAAIVIGVYWWGVGSGSRYEPPPVEHLTTVEGAGKKP
jgi:low temperature requirement protein LtrA